jgi:hypothetical protein
MRRTIIIAAVAIAIIASFLVYRQKKAKGTHPISEQSVSIPKAQTRVARDYSARRTNQLGDSLTDAEDPVFRNQVFPKFRDFVATLDRLGMNPLQGELQPASCSKIRIINIPNGIICPFVIGEGWTADYTENPDFSGITRFGQRGPDNPYRAISHADTNTLRRLSQGAIVMPEAEVWRIAERVADAFGIDRSKFETPQMHEEGLFEYRLGIYTVRYRKKGSDPVNQMNYTREFSLKATSPTTAVLVNYSHLEATLR